MTKLPLLLLGASIGVGVYLILGFVYFLHYFYIGKALARNAVPYQQNPENFTETIVISGDSTGVGTGVTDPEFSVAGYFGKERPAAKIINLSVNGLTTREILERLRAMGPAHAELILLETGGNDILGATNITQLNTDIDELLTEAQKRSDKVILQMPGNVGVSPIFPFPANLFFGRQTRLVRAVFITKAAEHNVPFVDFFKEPKDDPFYGHLEYYAVDRLHLSNLGYKYWYEHIQEKL